MCVRPEQRQHVEQIIDIAVQIEQALAQRHLACIDPVRDIDVGMRQHRLDRSPEQRSEMPRHRSDDEKFRLKLVSRRGFSLFEVQKAAERLRHHHRFGDRYFRPAFLDFGNAELRPSETPRRSLEDLHGRGHRSPERGIG
jgi:hypothetical protein